MDFLKAELERKRKVLEAAKTVAAPVAAASSSTAGKVYVRRGDIERVAGGGAGGPASATAPLDQPAPPAPAAGAVPAGAAPSSDAPVATASAGTAAVEGGSLPRAEVIRRLRRWGQPVTLYGESDGARLSRLLAWEDKHANPDLALGGGHDIVNPFLGKEAPARRRRSRSRSRSREDSAAGEGDGSSSHSSAGAAAGGGGGDSEAGAGACSEADSGAASSSGGAGRKRRREDGDDGAAGGDAAAGGGGGGSSGAAGGAEDSGGESDDSGSAGSRGGREDRGHRGSSKERGSGRSSSKKVGRQAAAALQAAGADPHKVLFAFFKGVLREWEDELDRRPEEVAHTPAGRQEAKQAAQTREYLRPFFRLCRKKALPDTIRERLIESLEALQRRDYKAAGDAYIRLAVGNAAWLIGVSQVGLHERAAREKVYLGKIAHVMNDETQRKYITSLKRLITFLQERDVDADPSRKLRA